MPNPIKPPLIALAILITAGCDQQAGFTPLFTTLSDFIVEDGQASYVLKDGIITGTTAIGSPNTFLSTKATYSDFILEFEVLVDGKLNSGVQIRSRSRETAQGHSHEGRYFGPQVEIEAGPGQAGYIYGEATSRGWLSPEPRSKDPAINQHNQFKNREWNHYRIIAQGARIRTYLNGKLIADLADEEIYRTHPQGHIGLQVHSIPAKNHPLQVSWRNLRIQEI